MREIKFKFWLKDDESMVGWFDAIDSFGGIEYFMLSDEVQRLQFIGLTDTDGVEIYSDDIVNDHNGIGVVKYSDKRAAYRVVYGDGTAKWLIDYNLRGERKSIKVIGNERQNPELLEQ